jgi:methyl-accepting chemotaxis protein
MASIRGRLIGGASAIVVVVAVVSVLVSLAMQDAIIERDRAAQRSLSIKSVSAALSGIEERLKTYVGVLSRSEALARAVESRDAARLQSLLVADFKGMSALDPAVSTIEVTDAKGVILMRGHNPARFGDDKSKTPMIQSTLAGRTAHGMTVSPTSNEVAQDAVAPLTLNGAVVGTVKVGSYLRDRTAEDIRRQVGAEVVFVVGGKLNASTIKNGEDFLPSPELVAEAKGKGAKTEVVQSQGAAFDATYAYLGDVDGRAVAGRHEHPGDDRAVIRDLGPPAAGHLEHVEFRLAAVGNGALREDKVQRGEEGEKCVFLYNSDFFLQFFIPRDEKILNILKSK